MSEVPLHAYGPTAVLGGGEGVLLASKVSLWRGVRLRVSEEKGYTHINAPHPRTQRPALP